MEYVITTSALTKKYGKHKAVDEVDINVPSGSVYGIIGKNGAGKTTLMRVLCDLQRADGGEYTLFGVSNADKKIKNERKRIGAMIEKPMLYTDMTAKENLCIQAEALGLPSFDPDALLKLAGLENTGKKTVGRFSFGMKQRLGIALTLVGSPDLVFLDEPVNGLDPQGIVEIRELILRLNREQNITFVISSHILDELSKIATDYCIMDGGRVVRQINANQLQSSFRKCFELTVTDTKALSVALDKMGLPYEIKDEKHAVIYEEFKISELVGSLSASGCELLTVREVDESLETYFLKLTGGDNNA